MSQTAPDHPGAVAPERTRTLQGPGVALHLSEWGDPGAAPVLLCHGMFDHGRGFDLLAPFLAERFHVVAMDARGHGDSSWSDAYSWSGDLEDIGVVLASLGRPAHVVGHSKGGGQATDAAAIYRDSVRQVVNIDGFGPPDDEGFSRPGAEADDRSLPERFAEFLDRRRKLAEGRAWRAYPEIEDLVERRLRQNPRLSREWLRYFASHGARRGDAGWTWKSDPLMGMGFGPFKPEWIGRSWRHLRAPLLAMIGSEPDTWGPIPEETRKARLADVQEIEHAVVRGAGHFAHMERPQETANLILEFLEP